ncbi:hypothetical protein EO986_07000 [Morganella morganii subsp. morganii]|uniref:hypothetical protein n=1 Tax=Morganella morganii TaxID=582 RepID=UPI000DF9958A|nr:hypothetical protein [Morganella morganii]QCY20800.1 hypothetical protein EO986_07000 [Morganella morganii subsp. morganii]STZ12050.1 Uncharacterised protein [Morganella morganii]
MANKKNTPEKPQEPGGLPPELMVPGQVNPVKDPETAGNEPVTETVSAQNFTPESDPEADGVYVVVKGRSVQHNGELYRENQQITLDDADACRLMNLGAVMSLEAVRKILAKANRPGTVTINGR